MSYESHRVGKANADLEYLKLEEALNGEFDVHRLRTLYVEPKKPKEGMICKVDGVQWNPGKGQGYYVRENATWKKLSTDDAGGLISLGLVDRYGMYVDADGVIKAFIGQGGESAVEIASDSPISVNTEYFVFVQRDTNTLKMWIDGTLQAGTATSTATLAATSPDFVIGQLPNGNEPITGNLDDFGVGSRALTDTEISNLNSAGVPEGQAETSIDYPEASAELLGQFCGISDDGTVAVYSDYDKNPSKFFVYRKTGGSWALEDTVEDPNTSGNAFAWAIRISGDGSTIVVGAPERTHGGETDAGEAYIYRESGGSWTVEETITPTAYDRREFGTAVDINYDGDVVVITSREPSGAVDSYGIVTVYTESGGSWSANDIDMSLTAAENNRVINRVAFSRDATRIFFGLPWADTPGGEKRGQINVYENDGGWSKIDTIYRPTEYNQSNFGARSIAPNSDGSLVAINADDDASDNDVSTVEIFEEDSGSWSHLYTLPATSYTEKKTNAVIMSSDGNVIFVGRYQANYDTPANTGDGVIQKYVRSGDTWPLDSDIPSSNNPASEEDGFGFALACTPSADSIASVSADGVIWDGRLAILTGYGEADYDLVSYWKFDETSGTNLDDEITASNNDLTISGTYTLNQTAIGWTDKSILFTNAEASVSADNLIDFSGDFCFFGHIKVTSLGSVQRILTSVGGSSGQVLADGTTYTKLTSEPATGDGKVAYADGTSWDPGSGEGLYMYYNSTWNKLG